MAAAAALATPAVYPAFFFVLEKGSKSARNAVIPTFPMHRPPDFDVSGTNGPHSLSRVKVGTHSALLKGSHTTAHTAKHGALSSPGHSTVLTCQRNCHRKNSRRKWMHALRRVSASSGVAAPLSCGNLFFCYSVVIFAPLLVWPTRRIINQDY